MTDNAASRHHADSPDAHAAFDALFKAHRTIRRIALDDTTPQPIKVAAIAAACLSERAVVELSNALLPTNRPADMMKAS